MSAIGTTDGAQQCDLSLVVPTYNEAGNITPLLSRLDLVLDGLSWELLIVDDDSPDGTSEMVEAISLQRDNVCCLRRIGRRGLASACIEGFWATKAPFIGVMDADLQHDEALLPRMFDILRAGQVELVVASRYVEGGSIGDLPLGRRVMSYVGTSLARQLLGVGLQDPMSGFFMFRRDLLKRSPLGKISGAGFKILLDIVVSTKPVPSFTELPYTFRPRHSGTSKFNASIGLEFLRAVAKSRLKR
jgi:dolichol-phosphate mannosyltransferase